MMPLYGLKQWIRSLLPQFVLGWYYRACAMIADWWYGHPSQSMIVIGVTGTNGKSTTVSMIGHILMHAGYRVGWTSTATMRIGDRQWLNDTKMTMAGPFLLQRLLFQMRREGCSAAIIEVSSEGLAQSRQIGVAFDMAVFTNLTPEHLERHGGMEHYIAAKKLLFQIVGNRPPKKVGGKTIPSVIVSNLDDDVGKEMLEFSAGQRIGYAVCRGAQDPGSTALAGVQRIAGVLLDTSIEGSRFSVDGCPVALPLPGVFNVSNALAAIGTTRAMNIPLATVAEALAEMHSVPGRMEWIREGQPFLAMVDYSPEPASLGALYEYVSAHHTGRVIHVLGSAGGGRDKARRPVMGQIAAANADVVIVTNEDPYDEDPQLIIDQVAEGARGVVSPRMKQLETIIDRRKAIQRAVELAVPGDLVLLTGKACEQAICIAGGKKTPWDDRIELRGAIKERYANA